MKKRLQDSQKPMPQQQPASPHPPKHVGNKAVRALKKKKRKIATPDSKDGAGKNSSTREAGGSSDADNASGTVDQSERRFSVGDEVRYASSLGKVYKARITKVFLNGQYGIVTLDRKKGNLKAIALEDKATHTFVSVKKKGGKVAKADSKADSKDSSTVTTTSPGQQAKILPQKSTATSSLNFYKPTATRYECHNGCRNRDCLCDSNADCCGGYSCGKPDPWMDDSRWCQMPVSDNGEKFWFD